MGGSSRKRKRPVNGETQGAPSKRRRASNAHQNRPNSRNDSSKNSKQVPVKDSESSKPSTSTEKEKRKHRPRCHNLCSEAVDKITKALRSSPNPIGHLFKRADDDGMPYALLSDIVPILSLPPRLLTLSATQLPLLNGNEHIFQMALNDVGQFIVKYAPVDFSIEDATVYLDRIPYPCSQRLLEKLCVKFGTPVDIRIPIRIPAPLHTANSVLKRKGTQHKGLAFVQFASKEEAEAICKEFSLNHPIVQQKRTRWFFNRGKRVHMGQHATKIAALTALRHDRMMRLKLRLEKELCRKLKLRQWRKEWKERRRRKLRERRKKRKLREKLRKEGKLVEKKKKRNKKKKKKEAEPETPKLTKKEKKKEANKRRRKRLRDLRKEAKRLLAETSGIQINSDSESAMDTSGEEERVKTSVPGPNPLQDNGLVKENGESKGEEEKKMKKEMDKPAEDIKKKRRRCKRKEIRKSVKTHFIDVQAIPFREYQRMREEYLRLRKEAEERDRMLLKEFTAKNSNHKREEFREANWNISQDGQ